MSELITIDPELARKHGEARQAVHANNSTPRFFEDRNQEDIMGVVTELAFEQWSGLRADMNTYEHGDGCKDFHFQYGGRVLTIDVKGAAKPFNLLLKQKDAQRSADILVLAKVEGNAVSFLGWEHKSMMLISPVKDFGYGIVNHYRPAEQLRPMEQLKFLLDNKANE